MDQNTKSALAVSSLLVGLLMGINFMVSEDANANWLFWALLFLGLALLFWLWIMRDRRAAEEAADEALRAAEENAKKLQASVDTGAEHDEKAQEGAPVTVPPEVTDEGEEPDFDVADEPVAEAPAEEAPAEDDAQEPVAVEDEGQEPDFDVADETADEDVDAQLAAEAASREPDDLTRIEGIGPYYEKLLHQAGVTTFAQLAELSEDDLLRLVVEEQGGRKSASMVTWAEQAKLAAKGDWDGLEQLQEQLSGGRRS